LLDLIFISYRNYFQVSLLTSDGNTKDDLRLPTDETLLAQVFWVEERKEGKEGTPLVFSAKEL
jgi:hypothetical protein